MRARLSFGRWTRSVVITCEKVSNSDRASIASFPTEIRLMALLCRTEPDPET
jgi:hypothetical protein